MPEISFTMSAMTGGMVWVALIAKKGGHRTVGAEDDRATMAAITPNGPSLWFSLCPYKRNNPRATVPGAEADADLVDKHDPGPVFIRERR